MPFYQVARDTSGPLSSLASTRPLQGRFDHVAFAISAMSYLVRQGGPDRMLTEPDAEPFVTTEQAKTTRTPRARRWAMRRLGPRSQVRQTTSPGPALASVCRTSVPSVSAAFRGS